jgi:hypothetical protein
MILEAFMIAASMLPTGDGVTVVDNTLPICKPDDGSKQEVCVYVADDGTRIVRVNYGKISMEA